MLDVLNSATADVKAREAEVDVIDAQIENLMAQRRLALAAVSKAALLKADAFQVLARRLFDVGFMACWGELSPASRESLIASIEAAITAPTTPTEVLLELLALAEYMERRDQQLPLNIRMLGDIATRCGAFSKALHYRELEYQALAASRSSPRLVEALVSLHRSLGQPEAALGVLTYAQQRLMKRALHACAHHGAHLTAGSPRLLPPLWEFVTSLSPRVMYRYPHWL
jgi:phosphatidylinositol kinase/protein kinase (PI-3  family)